MSQKNGVQWEGLWRRAFAARLEKWVKRQGYSHISDEALLEIAKRIEEADPLETHPESPPATALISFGGPNGGIEE
jgi:hypothetical protein